MIRIAALLAAGLLLTRLPHALKNFWEGYTLTARFFMDVAFTVMLGFIMLDRAWFILPIAAILVASGIYRNIANYLFFRRVEREGAETVARQMVDDLVVKYHHDYERVGSKLARISNDMLDKTQFHKDFADGPLHDERTRMIRTGLI